MSIAAIMLRPPPASGFYWRNAMRVLAFLVALASAAAAQEARPVPRLPDGRPDLNGV